MIEIDATLPVRAMLIHYSTCDRRGLLVSEADDDSAWFASGDAYEGYVGRWSRPVARLFLDWLALPAGLGWVDVGCGTGALTGVLLDKVEPVRVVGVEPSGAFLKVARANVTDGRAEITSGDATALPLGDQELDVAVSGLVLNFVPDQAKALAEMTRVLKPGGTIGAYVWDYAGEMQLMRFFWDAVTELFADGADHDEGNRFPICDPAALAELFNTGGLKAIDTCALDAPTVFADFEDYWTPFLRGQGPAGTYCVSLSDTERDKLRQHLHNALASNPDGPIEMIARAWAVRGTVPDR